MLWQRREGFLKHLPWELILGERLWWSWVLTAVDPLPVFLQRLSFLRRRHNEALSIPKLRLPADDFGRNAVDLDMNFSYVTCARCLGGLVDALIDEILSSEFAHAANLLL